MSVAPSVQQGAFTRLTRQNTHENSIQQLAIKSPPAIILVDMLAGDVQMITTHMKQKMYGKGVHWDYYILLRRSGCFSCILLAKVLGLRFVLHSRLDWIYHRSFSDRAKTTGEGDTEAPFNITDFYLTSK